MSESSLRVLNDQLEDERESPEYVRISAAAAMELGLKKGRMQRGCGCGCINLLQTYAKSCYSNCSYCGLARERPGLAEEKSFIRVDWPVFSTAAIAQKIAEKEANSTVGRVCVSQVQSPRAYEDMIAICREIHTAAPAVPMSALVSATTLDEDRLEEVERVGVDIIGVGLDAATPELFDKVRGRSSKSPHDWEYHWKIVRSARQRFGPMNVNCHIMVGLGENDRDLVTLFDQMKQEQIAAYLFSFNPEEGTDMAEQPKAPLHRWRRVQLVKNLIENFDSGTDVFRYNDEGNVAAIDLPMETIERAINGKSTFMTDGCPDRAGEMTCNRPYGSYRPSEEFRDYPFQPDATDLIQIRRQLQLEEILAN